MKKAMALVEAERRGRALAAALRPRPGTLWELTIAGDANGAALMAAGRWASRLGAGVVMRLGQAPTDNAAWKILAHSSRLQGLTTDAEADGDSGLVIIEGRERRLVRNLPDADAAWHATLTEAAPLVEKADAMSPRMTCAQCRAVDRTAMDIYGVPGLCLMENAAVAATLAAMDMLAAEPAPGPVLAVVGGGNNGGDGLAVVRGLRTLGVPAEAALLKPAERLAGDAAVNLRLLTALTDAPVHGIHDRPKELFSLARNSRLVVDALLGTGFQGGLSPAFRTAIEAVNASGRPVLALDIPSGLHGDTGAAAETAVVAGRCITFAAVKIGLTVADGPRHSGEVYLGDIGAPTGALTAAYAV